MAVSLDREGLSLAVGACGRPVEVGWFRGRGDRRLGWVASRAPPVCTRLMGERAIVCRRGLVWLPLGGWDRTWRGTPGPFDQFG